jgi:hypothetical protein
MTNGSNAVRASRVAANVPLKQSTPAAVKAHAFNSIGRSFRIESAGACKDKAFTPRQSRKIIKLSQRNGWPAGSPVNASSRTSRCATHDSGPVWFAPPFWSRIFTFSLCAFLLQNSVFKRCVMVVRRPGTTEYGCSAYSPFSNELLSQSFKIVEVRRGNLHPS